MTQLSERLLNDRHVEAAGRALKEIKKLGDPVDAQVTIALMGLYLCSQCEILLEDYVSAMTFNMQGIGSNPEYLMRTIEKIHKAIEPTLISVPVNFQPKSLN